jgi:hypothetical protein
MTSEEMGDRQRIVDLCVNYAIALDTRDWDRLRQVFTPDAVADYSGDLGMQSGYEAIERACRGALERLTASQHLLGNHLVRFSSPDVADALCYFQATHVDDRIAGERIYVIAGRYDDHCIRTPEGWKITYKKLTPMWVSGNPAVLGA